MKGWTIFATELGEVGLAWHDAELLRVVLPDDPAAMRQRLDEHASESPPPEWIQRLRERLVRHLAGEPQDFTDVPLAWSHLPPFHRSVYEATRAIEAGRTMTYGELADRAGSPGGARAVGQAMAHNPHPIVMPCHRVVAAGGRPGGYTAAGGVSVKARLLRAEGARLPVSLRSL